MKKRRPLDRARLKEKPRSLKKEWVSIEAGDVCVWGMNAARILTLGERVQRPAVDPRGGADLSSAAIWLVLLCTYEDETPEAQPVWNQAQIGEILELSAEDFASLSQAAQRVNGKSAESIQSMRDFTPATEAPSTSDSSSSASSSSTDSPPSLATSATPT